MQTRARKISATLYDKDGRLEKFLCSCGKEGISTKCPYCGNEPRYLDRAHLYYKIEDGVYSLNHGNGRGYWSGKGEVQFLDDRIIFTQFISDLIYEEGKGFQETISGKKEVVFTRDREAYFVDNGVKSEKTISELSSKICAGGFERHFTGNDLVEAYTKLFPEWKLPDRFRIKGVVTALRIIDKLIRYPQLSLLYHHFKRNDLAFMWSDRPGWAKDLNLEGTNPAEILRLSRNQFRLAKEHSGKGKGRDSMDTGLPPWRAIRNLERIFGTDYAQRLIEWEPNWRSNFSQIREIAKHFPDKGVLARWLLKLDIENRHAELKGWILPILKDTIDAQILNGRRVKLPNFARLREEHDREMRERERQLEIQRRANKEAWEREKAEIDRKLALVSEGLSRYEWQHEEWYMEVPRTVEEFEEEGKALNHCVGTMGYSRQVAEGKAAIFMLRKDGEPCITIEIRGNRIIQAFGKRNRKPKKDEQKIIDLWWKFYQEQRQLSG